MAPTLLHSPAFNLNTKKNNRILIVDDNKAIHEDFRKILGTDAAQADFEAEVSSFFSDPTSEAVPARFELSYSLQGTEALELVKKAVQAGKRYSLVFMDMRMPPGWDGLETSLKLWEADPDLQIVICTAYSDKSWEELMGNIHNPESLLILKKPFDAIEVLQLAHALTEKWSLLQSSRRNVEELAYTVGVRTHELQISEQRYRMLSSSAPIGIFECDAKGLCLYVNTYWENIVGLSLAEAIGKSWWLLMQPEDNDNIQGEWMSAVEAMREFDSENRYRRPDGEVRWLHMRSSAIRSEDGKVIGHVGTVEDITQRKRLESQLLQSQKMETVGKLAGGVAHEFNSIMTAIIGQSELLLCDLPPESPLIKNASEISKAAGRAATLTRQLLAYGRKQLLQPESLNLNTVITNMEGMFRHLTEGEVETRIVPAPGLKAVKADAGQIEQVIANMVMNAHDSMPNGGKLILETGNVTFDEDSVGNYPELKPGNYVMLAISDTGTGMSEDVKARVFEPFFSTKAVGRGTGLGLSTSYGIVKQSGGHISVYSEPSRGTTFKIYLPQDEQETKIPLKRMDAPNLPGGSETILLVEDDPALREMAATLLRRLGYTVLAASNGIEALSLKQHGNTGHIDLLFTDVVMPHMSGKELADRVQALYPHTRILFTSAYTENAIVHQGVLNKGVLLLQKPFTPSGLAHKLREVLDRPAA